MVANFSRVSVHATKASRVPVLEGLPSRRASHRSSATSVTPYAKPMKRKNIETAAMCRTSGRSHGSRYQNSAAASDRETAKPTSIHRRTGRR